MAASRVFPASAPEPMAAAWTPRTCPIALNKYSTHSLLLLLCVPSSLSAAPPPPSASSLERKRSDAFPAPPPREPTRRSSDANARRPAVVVPAWSLEASAEARRLVGMRAEGPNMDVWDASRRRQNPRRTCASPARPVAARAWVSLTRHDNGTGWPSIWAARSAATGGGFNHGEMFEVGSELGDGSAPRSIRAVEEAQSSGQHAITAHEPKHTPTEAAPRSVARRVCSSCCSLPKRSNSRTEPSPALTTG
mmetsp:Transcript_71463/g.140332  ORF Transcript_71463/g.140332 Transcript_71463/m.140332 type:complete len:250 (-) Transcript_71463:270-1019(-)